MFCTCNRASYPGFFSFADVAMKKHYDRLKKMKDLDGDLVV